MSQIQTKNSVLIPKQEYSRLKRIDQRFDKLLSYVDHLKDIAVARKEIKQKKFYSQEKLFRKLGS